MRVGWQLPARIRARVARSPYCGRVELAGQLFADWMPDRIEALVEGLDEVLETIKALLEEQENRS